MMRVDTIEIYKSKRILGKRTQWRWRYVRSNGAKLADGAESYANIGDLLGSLATVLGVPREELLSTTSVARTTSDRTAVSRLIRPSGGVAMVVIKR